MRREKFLALHSPYFDKAFGPTNQHRVLRRRGLVNNLPEGIKYVLDLTPPVEGEDAVYLMTELCCSLGVRRWYQAGKRWNVSEHLVGGPDEHQMELYTMSNDAQAVENPQQLSTTAADDPTARGNWIPEPKGMPIPGSAPTCDEEVAPLASTTDALPLEYTSVRHRVAIERVLHAAVEGLDPRINSAPKLWTTFAVAKYFEITHSPLTDYIVSWLRAPPNSYFLEVLPETSQKIADGLQCWDLCRDTFAILVGEEALGNVCRTRDQPKQDAAHSVYGRRREYVHEDYQTRIEYASKSFIERVGSRFGELVNESMAWLDDIPAYSVLSEFEEDIEYKEAIKELKDILKAYVRGRIYWVCCRDYKGLIGPVPDTRRIGSDLFPTTSFTETYNGLLLLERIFTQSFWKTLKQEDFSQGSINTHTDRNDLFSPVPGWTSLARKMHDAKFFDEVVKWRVEGRIRRLDDTHAALYPPKEPKIIQTARPRRLDGRSQVDDPIKRLGGLSLLSPKKAKLECTDERSDSEHDGKRRRLSSSLEEWPLGRTEGSQSSSQIPIRLAPATSFAKNNVDILPPLLIHHLKTLISPGYAKGKSALVSDFSRRFKLFFSYQELIHLEDTLPESLFSKVTTPQAQMVSNSQIQVTVPASFLDMSRNDALSPQLARKESKYSGFDLNTFLLRVSDKIEAICTGMLAAPDAATRSDTLELVLTDTLVCLDQSEWKYLPLWAGGNDDGSGGVFDDSVPLAEAGLSAAAPGPGFHTGLSSTGSSEYELVGGGGSLAGDSSTPHTSTVVNTSVGASEQMDRRRVYEADSVWSEVLAGKRLGGDGGSSVGTGMDEGKDKGKGKEKMAYADSEWSEVTAGRDVGDLPEVKVSTTMEEEGSGARRAFAQDELLDDIWDDGGGDDVASGLESDSGEDDHGDGDDNDEDEDMVLL